MDRSMKNKVVVLTGGANGIGYEIADKCLKHGAKKAILLDIDEIQGQKAAQDLISKHGQDKAVFLKCDVTSDLDEIYKQIIDSCKTVDILVNSAGILSESKKTFEINATALIEWSMRFYEHMRRDKGGNAGTILNIASTYGFRVVPFYPYYQASKFAVMGITRSLGHKINFDKTGVRVVALCPSFTETSIAAIAFKKKSARYSADVIKAHGGIVWQKVDAVGDAAIEVFGKAESGTAWLIEGGNPIQEVLETCPVKSCYIRNQSSL